MGIVLLQHQFTMIVTSSHGYVAAYSHRYLHNSHLLLEAFEWYRASCVGGRLQKRCLQLVAPQMNAAQQVAESSACAAL